MGVSEVLLYVVLIAETVCGFVIWYLLLTYTC